MAELDKGKPVSLEELIVTTLAMADAVTKLLIEKGVITEGEFKQKLLEERAVYQRILHPSNYGELLNSRNNPSAIGTATKRITKMRGEALASFVSLEYT